MVTSIAPILEQHMARAKARAGGQDAYVRFDFAAYIDSSTSTISFTKQTLDQSHVEDRNRAGEYCCNQQYSVTAVTTSAGAIAERYAYTAYGQPTVMDASASVLSSSAINNRYTYTGREWDATLGLHHFRARWMSPVAGRFSSRDPIHYLGGINLYRILDKSILRSTDPSGLHDYCWAIPGCNEESEKGNCGADATDPFTQYLALITPYLRNLPWDQWGPPFGYLWMNNNGMNIDYYLGNAQFPCCATKECKNSVRFCGSCIRDTALNNILYGFVGAAHGISNPGLIAGGNYNELMRNWRFEGCEQQSAYLLGAKMWDYAQSANARLSTENFCAIFNNIQSRRMAGPLNACIIKPFKDCSDCGQKFTLRDGKKGIGNGSGLPPLPISGEF